VIEAVADGGREAGAEIRLRSLAEAVTRDVEACDAIVLGVEEQESRMPPAAKRWLDALGFTGWRAFRDKRGCVFATRSQTTGEGGCVALARVLEARGMRALMPWDLGCTPPLDARAGSVEAAHALGVRFARDCGAVPFGMRLQHTGTAHGSGRLGG
jgi:multimeric flavodoxin WrbA